MTPNRYKIFETRAFSKSFEKTASSTEYRLIRDKLDGIVYPELRLEPHYGPNIKKLLGYVPETWRYRIGHFRVFYSIDEKEKVVIVTAFRSRKEAYR